MRGQPPLRIHDFYAFFKPAGRRCSISVTSVVGHVFGLDFEQGELLFHGRKGAPRAPLVAHEWSAGVGHGVLHVGEQVHAALPITAGERLNLVVWMRSPAHRRAHGCPMCGSTERLSYAPQ